jgi:DNA-binding MarR family transcriptional regulator
MPNQKHAQFVNAVEEAAGKTLDPGVLHKLVSHNCLRAYQAIQPVFRNRMAKYELRQVDFSVLSLLKANPNIPQARVARAINLLPPDLAVLLDRLEARGLVQRQRNPLDKRSLVVRLTPDGLQLARKAEHTASKLEVEATLALSEQERAQLIGLLQKIFLHGSE